MMNNTKKRILDLFLASAMLMPAFGLKGQNSCSLENSSIFVYNDNVRSNIGDSLSSQVVKIFQDADINKDGKISVEELNTFQHWLVETFKYKENSTALHPNDFFTQGGGDCDDFAIMTTCMLNFYGIVAYVAGFGRVTINKHAISIVQVKNDETPGYLYYTLKGQGIPPGLYIPIDYEKVGGLNAIDRRWKIARIYSPVKIYGVYM